MDRQIAKTKWERIADQDVSCFARVVTGKTTGKATPEVIAAEVGAPAIVAEQQET